MQNTRFFDVEGFNAYLRANLKIGVLKIISDREDNEKFYATRPQERSFEIIPEELLANDSITQGNYFKKGVRYPYEELRFRVHKSFLLAGNCSIPKGKYRIRVASRGVDKPVVKTFVRGFVRWKNKSLPESLPLDKILNGELESYIIN